MRAFRKGAVIALASGLLLSTPATANAISSSLTDPSGDVGVAAATEDITNVGLNFDHSTITLTMTTASALPAFLDSSWSHGGGDGRVDAFGLSLNGEPEDSAIVVLVDGDAARVFDSASGDPTTDKTVDALCNATSSIVSTTLTVAVPSSCLDFPGQIEATAFSGALSNTDDADLVSWDVVDVAPGSGSLDDDPTPVSASLAGGYWQLGADGGVFAFGSAPFYGSTGNLHLNAPVVAMSAAPNGDGYRFVASDGGVFVYGNGNYHFYGSMGGQPLNRPIVGMATTPSGNGYWLVASDGGIFTYGDAVFYGSMGGHPLNRPIVGMAATPSGQGYWLVASDGGVFTYGDAPFYGSLEALRINQPIVGMASSPTGHGYWLATADGGIFAFADAIFYGSGAGDFPDNDVNSITASGDGYRLTGAGGTVESFGPSVYGYSDVSRYDVDLNQGIVGIASL